jgi:hypothetical protein
MVRREDGDDAVDGLGRVEGVQRREDEVAGLGREQRGLDGLVVAHFADQDDVRILTHRRAQGAREVRVSTSISRWLTIDFLSRWRNSTGSSMVTMCSLRPALMKSIIAASEVDLPEPVVPVHSTNPRLSSQILLEHRWQGELADGQDPPGNHAQDESDGAALLEDVAAEAPEAGHGIGDVDLEFVLEALLLRAFIIENAIAMVSSCINRLTSGRGRRAPSTRSTGWLPTLR